MSVIALEKRSSFTTHLDVTSVVTCLLDILDMAALSVLTPETFKVNAKCQLAANV